MGPPSAAQVFWIPPIYTVEWGWNFDMLFNYLVALFFFGGHMKSLVDTFFNFLKAMVNKIHFSFVLPVVGRVVVDFSKYTWDDEFFDAVRDAIKDKITAKESEARSVKLKYKPKFEAAKSEAERLALLEEYQGEMKGLTTKTVGELKTFYPEIWKSAFARFKDEALAEQWLESQIKAGVVEKKNGSAPVISITDTLTKLDTLPEAA